MMLNRPYVYIAALSCGLFFTPTAGLGAQTASGAPAQAASGQNSAAANHGPRCLVRLFGGGAVAAQEDATGGLEK